MVMVSVKGRLLVALLVAVMIITIMNDYDVESFLRSLMYLIHVPFIS